MPTLRSTKVNPKAGRFGPVIDVKDAKLTSYPRNYVIYHEDDQAENVFIILKGAVKLLRRQRNGKSRIVRLYSCNQWLGLEGLGETPLDSSLYHHSCITLGDVELACLPTASVRLLEQEKPLQYRCLVMQGVRNFRQHEHWVAAFSSGGIRCRFARLIEILSNLNCDGPSERVRLLTANEMADILGSSPGTVRGVLNEFKRDGVLLKLEKACPGTYEINARQLKRKSRR